MTDNEIIDQLHTLVSGAAADVGHASYLLRRAAREYGRPPPPTEPSPLAGVPAELILQVLTEEVDEQEAIERGKRAAAAKSFEERDAILSGLGAKLEPAGRQAPPYRPVGVPPWGEP